MYNRSVRDWIIAFCTLALSLPVYLAFPAGFNALPGATQARWLNAFSASWHDPVTGCLLRWGLPPVHHPWSCDWFQFTALFGFYIIGATSLMMILCYLSFIVLSTAEDVGASVSALLCRRSPWLRRFINPLEDVPALVDYALRCGFTPADIQAHLAQALHRETPEYKAAWKYARNNRSFREAQKVCCDLEKELDPWPVNNKKTPSATN